ncbi:MBL fold metallo-hydrolase [Alkalibacter rhizosphaerae]|uniref:MBL fold metallo-hydrolase n=1 Tax=Alkalibacter rhizosphaerae TaxID=2815577 RepID=A0A974XGM2_9FIRM|nr:MBL fold metallo-hydrolase [Alkalibacter rhizosphaerae]QSX09448.1 MBL fold metallo-hydrolase [Alkalibacter rhizosphaerae]
MIIKTLAENTAISEEFRSEHGLSLHIETQKHKVLFDTGASSLFSENAKKMDVDLSKVDIAVISHGHYDHGDGIHTFLEQNEETKVHIHRHAFGEYYSTRPNGDRKYIGLDKGLLRSDRFIFLDETCQIDDEAEIFSGVEGTNHNPTWNKDLYMKGNGTLVRDDFSHEQNLVLHEAGKDILIAGCAHKGILNVIDHYYKWKNAMPDYVIGGFHLYNRSKNRSEDPASIDTLAKELLDTGAKFYTCHCTGLAAYERLKAIMGKRIGYLSTGSHLII